MASFIPWLYATCRKDWGGEIGSEKKSWVSVVLVQKQDEEALIKEMPLEMEEEDRPL